MWKTPGFEADQKTLVLYILVIGVVRVSEHIMHIATYVRVPIAGSVSG